MIVNQQSIRQQLLKQQYPLPVKYIWQYIKDSLLQESTLQGIFDKEDMIFGLRYILNYELCTENKPICAKIISIKEAVVECLDCGLFENSHEY